MFGRSDYLATCTTRQDILICQLHCEQLLLAGILSPEGFRVQCGVLDLRCAAVVSGLPLPAMPPAVELGPRSRLQQFS
jgi:hypothetical protein